MEIGVLGAGAMAVPVARNLLRAGHTVRVWNRTEEKVAPLVDCGAIPAARPSEAVGADEIVISLLSDDAALDAVTPEVTRGLAGAGVHLSMSTVSPDAARRAAAAHTYVAGPVFGRPAAAEAGTLVVCLSGPPEAREKVKPLLPAISAAHHEFGDDPGAAHLVKLAGNFLIIALSEAWGEALALVEKGGLPRSAFADLVAGTFLDCPLARVYGPLIAEQRFTPAGFRLSLGEKDVRLLREAAAALRVPLPVASLVHDRFLRALAAGRQDEDWVAITAAAREDAGLT